MSKQEIDDHLAKVAQPKRATLQKLRQTIRNILPDAEEVISYGMPAFRLNGKVIAGFAAFKNHLAYLPHSGSVPCRTARRPRCLHKHRGLSAGPDQQATPEGAREETGSRPTPAGQAEA